MLSRLQPGDPVIHAVVCDFVTRRRKVNLLLLAKLTLLTSSPEYTGDCSRGVWVGSSTDTDTVGQVYIDYDDATAGGLDHDDGELDEDEADELVRRLADYVSDLAL